VDLRKIFSEQLTLLAERAKDPSCTNAELCDLTRAMLEIIETALFV